MQIIYYKAYGASIPVQANGYSLMYGVRWVEKPIYVKAQATSTAHNQGQPDVLKEDDTWLTKTRRRRLRI